MRERVTGKALRTKTDEAAAKRPTTQLSLWHCFDCPTLPIGILRPAPRRSGLSFLKHRQNVAGGILEPRDVRTLALGSATENPLLVRLNISLIRLELHTTRAQILNG